MITRGCRYCTSCGKDFPARMGGFWLKTPSAAEIYDNGCAGYIRNRGALVSLCCSNPPSCSLCKTCGGEYEFETSIMYPNVLTQTETFGENCQSPLVTSPQGAMLCCKHG